MAPKRKNVHDEPQAGTGASSSSKLTTQPKALQEERSSSSAAASTNKPFNPAIETPVRISSTPRILRLLSDVISSSKIPQATKSQAREWKDKEDIPWTVLDDIYQAAKTTNEESSSLPSFFELVREGNLALKSPPPRERSKELQERLAKLQQDLDDRLYKDMVKGVTRKEDEAKEANETAFRTYKDQLGFGLNVVFTMFTLFVFFYVAARSVTSSESMRLLAGLVGAIFAMLMETTLLITQTTYTARDRVQFVKKYLTD